jgi:hypothetical protein
MSNPGSLRPGWQPGQSGNPSGANAITKALSKFRKFMAETTSTGHTRLYNVWNRLYLGAVNGNFIAGKFIVEQCQGKAKEFMDVTSNGETVGASQVHIYIPSNGRGPAAEDVKPSSPEDAPSVSVPESDGDTGSN